MIETAQRYLQAGLCALPASRIEKRPTVRTWSQYRTRMPTEQVWQQANGSDAICIVCGDISGNAEIIDFDAGGELFDAWAARIPHELLMRLVIQRTQHGGRHVFYRCEKAVCGNTKLAQRERDGKIITLIETRGEGGLFLCTPTPGYELLQGDMLNPPVLTDEERDLLLLAARELNEYLPLPVPLPATLRFCDRPGDDFNARGDVGAVLLQHGWTLVKDGENQYWRRPGKDYGHSATLKNRVFFCFSANAKPFEPNQPYSPFRVYALLNHGGDFAQAAAALRREGFGATPAIDANPPEIPADPGLLPAELLRVPGFVSEVMDYTLSIAPYPNQAMAFAGALALQAILAGRKVRDPGDNRTNIYVLGLANASAGKNKARKVNQDILSAIGMTECLGLSFASAEGLQDALLRQPSMLFQTDEFDAILHSINQAKDARYEAIMATLLTLYSTADTVYLMRYKAGAKAPGVIDQPCLVVFGSAIPTHFYGALSERMLTNGLVARMIIIESGPRPGGQEPRTDPPPERIMAVARWWAEYWPGSGNLQKEHPVPAIVPQTADAQRYLIETRDAVDAEYAQAEARDDPVGTTVWGRVGEHVRKLALLYAISENHLSPCIGLDAVKWASAFALHQTRRMLYMASTRVAENPFHAQCLRVLDKLRAAPNRELSHSQLLRRMKVDTKTLSLLIETLSQQGDIAIEFRQPKQGRPSHVYRLVSG